MTAPELVLTGQIDGRNIGTWRALDTSFRIGRAPSSAISSPHRGLPRLLAELRPSEGSWLLTNGGRTRLHASSTWVKAHFAPHAVVALQRGRWMLTWPELDVPCELSVLVRNPRPTDAPAPRDKLALTSVAGTQFPLAADDLDPGLRHRMAVLFEHVLIGGPPPTNLYRAAAERLSENSDDVASMAEALKRATVRLRDRVNDQRNQNLETVEQLGYYLVHVAESVTDSDLDQYPGVLPCPEEPKDAAARADHAGRPGGAS